MNLVQIGHIIVNLDCLEPRVRGELEAAMARRVDLTEAELWALIDRLTSSPSPLSSQPSLKAWRDRPPLA